MKIRLTKKLRAEVQKYLDLQQRATHPRGSFDTGGRWHPSPAEVQSCCASIRAPSKSWPWSLMVHCRSLSHRAAASGYTVPTLRTALSRMNSEAARP